MKRFWNQAHAAAAPGGFEVRLDTRPVKLPGGAPLILRSGPLTEAIAAEWDQAGENFTPEDLPLTRLASTAQERIPAHREDIVAQLAAYGLNDLLCYRATSPTALAARQHEQWTPWLRWAETELGLTLRVTEGLCPVEQPPGTGPYLIEMLRQQSNAALAALGVIVPGLGSLVLGLALRHGALTPDAACAAALLDELWQEAHWGQDAQAAARRRALQTDIALSATFLALAEAEPAK